MNDRIRKFSTQLSEAAPLAPELEGRTAPVPRSPITAMRVGIALATVAVLGMVGLVVADGDGRTPVTPAAGPLAEASTGGAIADAVSAALPAGFTLQYVERAGTNTAHAVAVNDRFDVLDIEIIATGPPAVITDEATPTEVGEVTDFTSTPEMSVPDMDAPALVVPGSIAPTLACAPPTTGAYTNTDPCTEVVVGDTPTTIAGIVTSATGCVSFGPTVSPNTDNVDASLDCTVVVDPSMPSPSIPVPDGAFGTPEGAFGTGEITLTTGVDAFGPTDTNIPSPFTAASASTDRVFVGIATYSINAVTTEGVAPAILGNLGDIANLNGAILALPEALAAVDLFTSANYGTSDVFNTRGVAIGSLSVSLSTRNDDGTTIVQVSFPGDLSGSGNDGSIHWHATTIDGRVFIVLLNPGDSGWADDTDPAALVQKIAEAGAMLGWPVLVEAGAYAPYESSVPIETTAMGNSPTTPSP